MSGSQPNINIVTLKVILQNSEKPLNNTTIIKAVILPKNASYSLRSTMVAGHLTDISLCVKYQWSEKTVQLWDSSKISTEEAKKLSETKANGYNVFFVEDCKTHKDSDILYAIDQDGFTANEAVVELLGEFLSDKVIV